MMGRFISVICPICQDEVKAIFLEECSGGYEMLRCPICALEFAHPLRGPSKDGYQAWYRGEAIQLGNLESYVDYAARLSTPRARRLRDYHIKALRFFEKLQFISPPRLLDVGCAEGSFLKALEELGFDVYGCDIAEEPIMFAKEVYGLKNVISSAPNELPPNWQDFDVITSFEVLEHTEKPLQFLTSLYHLLKSGGFLVLSVPHYGIHSIKRKKGGAQWDSPPEHLTRWPPQTLKFSLRKAGFSSKYIRIFQAGDWETFLDAVLPAGLENIYWRLWENKTMRRKQNYLEKIAEWVLRFSLLPFFLALKSKYVRYSFVIARKK